VPVVAREPNSMWRLSEALREYRVALDSARKRWAQSGRTSIEQETLDLVEDRLHYAPSIVCFEARSQSVRESEKGSSCGWGPGTAYRESHPRHP